MAWLLAGYQIYFVESTAALLEQQSAQKWAAHRIMVLAFGRPHFFWFTDCLTSFAFLLCWLWVSSFIYNPEKKFYVGFTQKQTQRPRFMLKHFYWEEFWEGKVRMWWEGRLDEEQEADGRAAPSTELSKGLLRARGPAGGHEPRQVSSWSLYGCVHHPCLKAVSGAFLPVGNTGRSGPEVRAQAETRVQLSAWSSASPLGPVEGQTQPLSISSSLVFYFL